MCSLNNAEFYGVAITAGSIISGFCCNFLSFRIQREAQYYRNPSNGLLNQQQFSCPFLLLILASLLSLITGVTLPLLFITDMEIFFTIKREYVTGGILSSLFLLVGYFTIEMFHYRIFLRNFNHNKKEISRERPITIIILVISAIIFLISIGF